jgi:lipoyl(octanoyl) transferase
MEAPASPAAEPSLAAWLAGRIHHETYAALAERLAWEVSEPGGRCPTLVVCELEPVITIGRLGSRSDVAFTDDELRSLGLGVRFTGRGGGAVLHGPGQVFAALFASLEQLGLGRHGVGAYLDRLEAGVEAALETLQCATRRVPGCPGILGRSGLLAAVSVAVRRGVACHGAFVNVSPALGPYQRVRTVAGPDRRGIASGAGTMGSVEADVRRRVRMADARTALVRGIGDAFGFTRVHVHAGFPLRLDPPVRPVPEVFSRVG